MQLQRVPKQTNKQTNQKQTNKQTKNKQTHQQTKPHTNSDTIDVYNTIINYVLIYP